jgi:hypothetical protein
LSALQAVFGPGICSEYSGSDLSEDGSDYAKNDQGNGNEPADRPGSAGGVPRFVTKTLSVTVAVVIRSRNGPFDKVRQDATLSLLECVRFGDFCR